MGYWNHLLAENDQKYYSAKFGMEVKYLCPKKIEYYSERYNKTVTVPLFYPSDGATGTFDLDTTAWWIHDKLCHDGTFDDGTLCSNWQASMILRDILLDEGYWFFANRWFLATFLFGGGKARDNGLFKTKKG